MIPGFKHARWRWHVAALAIYATLSVLILDHGESLTGKLEGLGSDPFAFVWFLAWWPWAISHHLNPLHTSLGWQPSGVYLSWITSVPFLSFIGLPLTLKSGPVLTYNVLTLCAPVLSAWMAYRLCLRLSGDAVAALIGGYLFGFSSYEMGQDLAALNLNFTVFIPGILLVVMMRLDDDLNRFNTVLLAALMLICEFLVCIEIFAIIFLFGGIAWLLAMLYLPERRPVLRRLFVDGLCTGPLVVIPILPFLVSMLANSNYVHLPDAWPYYFTADFLNLFIPTHMNVIGGHFFAGISKHFKGGIQEQDAYLGLPLIMILFFYARDYGRTPKGRFLVAIFLVLLISTFGPRLWINGIYTPIVLPWMIFVHLPLLSSALPARFALFVSLVVAIMSALWIADAKALPARRFRIALGVLACIVLLPKPHPWIKIPYSAFFQPGRVEAVLGKNPRILILPFAINGPGLLWQLESNFSFSQTGGYYGFPPRAWQHYAAVGELFGNFEGPDFVHDFQVFCISTHTQYVVAGPATSQAFVATLRELNWPARKIDDVTIFSVPNEMPSGAING